MVVVLVVAGACSDGGSDASDRTVATTSSSTRPPASTVPTAPVPSAPTATTGLPGTTTSTSPATGSTVAPGEVSLRGTVLTVFASARVLELDWPVNGYSRVALTEDTEYRLADGSPASLVDLDEGSTVEVTGEPGSPGSLIARLVVIVG